MSSSPYRCVLESLPPIRQRNPRAKKHKAKPNSMEHLHPLQDSALTHSDCREVESELIRRAIGGGDSRLQTHFVSPPPPPPPPPHPLPRNHTRPHIPPP